MTRHYAPNAAPESLLDRLAEFAWLGEVGAIGLIIVLGFVAAGLVATVLAR